MNDPRSIFQKHAEAISCAVCALLCVIIYAAVVNWFVARPLFVGAVMCAVYAVAAAAILLLFGRRRLDSSDGAEQLKPVLGDIMVNTVLKQTSPVVICDDVSGTIYWYNRAFQSLSAQAARQSSRAANIHGKNIADTVGIGIDRFVVSAGANMASGENAQHNVQHTSPKDSIPVAIEAKDGTHYSYKARSFPIKTPDRSYILVMFSDVTETESLKKKLTDDNIAVAYIIVDNLDELLQYEQEKYRSTSAQIEAILREWAAGSGGLLKEYERDKYLFFCSSAAIDTFIDSHFDILDRIHDIRVGDGNLPVTISIGMARLDGTLEEKERAAYAALDLALQRGGDQAALRSGAATDFYGGRTKTRQKRTRVRARVLAGELVMHISSASNVLVMGHKYADFDAVGAAAGIARLATFCGTEVNIVADTSDSNLSGAFAMLKKLPEYRSMFVTAAQSTELIRSDTLLIVVDVNNRGIFESPELADIAEKLVIIDHHRKTADFPRTPIIAYIEPSASSASELVAEMLEQSIPDGTLEQEEASLLLAGMLLDTKQFKKNTGTRTFSAALYLRNAGADPAGVENLFKSPFDEFVRVSRFEAGLQIFRGNLAIAVHDGDGDEEDRVAAAMAADKMLNIKGIDASFAIVGIGDVVFISARSGGKINVQLILEKMNGGGHFDSAGTQLRDTAVEEALAILKKSVDEYFEEIVKPAQP